MKKSILIILMATLLPYFSYGATETLLPEVKKALEVPPLDEKEMVQNSYVYLLTIDAKDDDYFDIAKKYLIANNQWLKERIENYGQPNSIKLTQWPEPPELNEKERLIVKIKDITFPCRELKNEHCIKDTFNQSKSYVKTINDNKEALRRYEYIIQRPNFTPLVNNNIAFLPLAPYQNYIYLSNLELYRAISFIDNGNISAGLNIFQKEIVFAQKLYTSNGYDLARTLGGNRLLAIYHTISVLLNQYPDLMQEDNSLKLKSLLSIFPTQEQLNLTSIVANLRDGEIYQFALLNYIDIKQALMKYADSKEQSKLESQLLSLNQSLNNLYLDSAPYIRLASSNLPEISNAYMNRNNAEYDIIGFTTQRIYETYDVKNYLSLVNLQLDILSKGLKAEQVPDFLAASGDKALNIITQKPFVWNKENSTISTDYLTIIDKMYNPMAVKIKFN